VKVKVGCSKALLVQMVLVVVFGSRLSLYTLVVYYIIFSFIVVGWVATFKVYCPGVQLKTRDSVSLIGCFFMHM